MDYGTTQLPMLAWAPLRWTKNGLRWCTRSGGLVSLEARCPQLAESQSANHKKPKAVGCKHGKQSSILQKKKKPVTYIVCLCHYARPLSHLITLSQYLASRPLHIPDQCADTGERHRHRCQTCASAFESSVARGAALSRLPLPYLLQSAARIYEVNVCWCAVFWGCLPTSTPRSCTNIPTQLLRNPLDQVVHAGNM